MPLTDNNDEDLTMEYAAGNAAAFEVLYQRHRGSLYRYVLRHCSDPHISEELYQDVWMKVINAAGIYKPTASFKTYLYHIAHNRVIDHYRQSDNRWRQSPLDIDSENTPAAAWAGSGTQPDQEVSNLRDINRLLNLVEALPEQQREAFLLREEAGLTLQQIAEVTGVGKETAKSRLRYAVNSLREGLQ